MKRLTGGSVHRTCLLSSLPSAIPSVAPLLLLAALVLAQPPAVGADEFVQADGTRLVVGTCPFEFVGTNCYYLMVYGADPGLRHYCAEVLEEAAAMDCSVIRTWGFNDGAGQWNALQLEPGVYDETVFQALDWVIAKADSEGLKVVLPLVNNWNDYGGMNQYVEWAREAPPSGEGFITVNGTHFELDGERYYFVGTNYWYGLNLGSAGAGGDRARLERELDHLKSLGITNLRVMAGSEGPDSEPWRMVPSLQTSPGVYNSEVLDGLDYLLNEMKERDLRAIMCLNNFWPWSGGMAQYVCWNGGGQIPYPPPEPGGDWNEYQDYASDFYSNAGAMQDFQDHINFIVNHVNPYTGLAYKDDPTVMTWELGNEPRGFHNNATNFNIWIDNTAAYIKSLDSNHLVTTGCEGDTPWPLWNGLDFVQNHNGPDIDYTTIHIWPQNWSWYDPVDPGGTYPSAESNARAYFNQHEQYAVNLGKPMILEEFGLARDGGSYDPASSTQWRDTFYTDMFDEVYASASGDGPAAGTNFWAWAGEGRPLEPYGSYWNPGDPWIGDPPHEHQGWYSVYDADATTLAVLAGHAAEIHALTGPTEHDDFYTDTNCRQFYRDHVTTVLNRVNTISGRTYKDDPTILAWELGNEPRCQSDHSGATLQAWIEEMAAHYKSIDTHHLLTTGQEGFWNYGSGPWWQNGSQGTDYIANHQVDDIDICTFHLWPNDWGDWSHSQSMQWVDDHIDDAHNVVGKPVFIGEFGLHRDQGGGTTARDLLYEEIFEAFRTQSGAGALYWILYHDAYPDHDNYGVYYPADVSTINVIMDAAEALQDTLPPENVTDFSADTRHLTEGYVDLAWTEPDELVGVRIYRKEVGGYPLYDDGGGTVPTWPASEDEAIADGWALIADLPYGSGAVDDGPLSRDMYYYAAFVMGCNGLLAPGNPLARDRALSYHLGDLDEDGSVAFEDLNTFSMTFDTCEGHPGFLPEADFGPTDDQTEEGLPETDGCIGFEDLMILALSYDGGAKTWFLAQATTLQATSDGGVVRFWVDQEPSSLPESHEAALRFDLSAIRLQGLQVKIHWEGSTAPEIIAGEAWWDQGWFHSTRVGPNEAILSAVRLGPRSLAGGAHTAARLRFTGCDAPPGVWVESVVARDPRNCSLAVELRDGPRPTRPTVLSLRVHPNPSCGRLHLTLEAPGTVTGGVYELSGRRVRSLGLWDLQEGRGMLRWDWTDDQGRRLSPGLYFIAMHSAGQRQIEKVLFLK